MQRALIIAASLAIILLGALQVTGGLQKIFGPSGDPAVVAAADKAIKASATFVPLAKDSATTGKVPGQSDPVAAPLLDAVFNVDVVKGKTLGDGDLKPLADWSVAAVAVGNSYILAGTGVTDPAKLDDKSAAKTDENTVTYAAELGRYLDAQLALQSALARIAAANKSAPKAALDQVGAGLTQLTSGSIETLAVPGLTPAWRQARTDALTAAAPSIAPLLNAAQCKSLHDTADAVAADVKDATLTDRLKAFNAALKC